MGVLHHDAMPCDHLRKPYSFRKQGSDTTPQHMYDVNPALWEKGGNPQSADIVPQIPFAN